MATNGGGPEPIVLYADLSADEGPTEIESMCPQCEENGVTKLLLTKIPFYKEVILMSFSCDHCGCRNNELQSGGKVEEQGVELTLHINTRADLNRTIVKSEYAAVKIPELSLEAPHRSQPGEITTVEGVLRRAAEGLGSLTSAPSTSGAQLDADAVLKVAALVQRIQDILDCDERNPSKFTLVLNDPSGNAFIENPHPDKVDSQLRVVHYYRTMEQNKMLGLVADDVVEPAANGDDVPDWERDEGEAEVGRREVLHFAVDCPACGAPTQTNMKVVQIPHFKDVVLMATTCERCGHKNTDVKAAGGVGEHGCTHTLKVTTAADLKRDVLKSDTCIVRVEELDLEAGMAALNGRFTTVEGLLGAMHDQLEKESMLMVGDSADGSADALDYRQKMDAILTHLKRAAEGTEPLTLVLDDPAGNSYVQSLTEAQTDDRLLVWHYDRDWHQNESLGLNDMRTENYADQ